MALAPGSRLGPYEVTALIGVGGMGEVYRATDTNLKRQVALKVLPAEFAHDAGRLSRFEREARALAALNHPNILTVFDVGRAGDTSYFAMELLQGGTLRERFDGRRVPWRKAVELAEGIAAGLAAAHAKSLIHRDLKPDNIFLNDDGVVKILDFGLARPTESSPRSQETTVTQAGEFLGTPGYLAPEQLRGQAADARADIFAFGCVLHELVAGRPVFRRGTVADTLAALLHDEAPSLLDAGSAIPPELDRVVARCLDKDPQQRFQSARDLAFIVKGLLADGRGSAGLETTPTPPTADTASIAVLPFVSMSADPDNEFFADGVSEEIINALARLPELHVAGRTSAFSFKGRHEDLRAIGEQLSVQTILEGSVRKAGERVRVTAQLVNAADGYHLWSERFDRKLEDIFEVQDEIARAIVDKLQVTLGRPAGRPLVEPQTDEPDAYQSYVKGRALLLKRGTGIWRALEALRTAVTIDPDYPQAWAGLAEAYAVTDFSGLLPPREAMGAAERAMERAMALGPDLAESHNAAAIVNHLWRWDWDAAEAHYRRSLELNPRYIQARCWYGLHIAALVRGRYEEAIAHCRRAVADDPLSAYAHTMLGLTLGVAGVAGESIASARTGIEHDPEAFLGHWVLQACYVFAGRDEEAVAQGEAVMSRFGRLVWSAYMQAVALAHVGRRDESEALYQELTDRSAREYVQPTPLAFVAWALNRKDDAHRHLESAVTERDAYLAFSVLPWPNVPDIQSDPRWADVRRRMGLEPA